MAGTRLPSAGERYNQQDEDRRNQVLETELNKRLERFVDIESISNRYILTSPNGTRYALTVDDAGILGTNPI